MNEEADQWLDNRYYDATWVGAFGDGYKTVPVALKKQKEVLKKIKPILLKNPKKYKEEIITYKVVLAERKLMFKKLKERKEEIVRARKELFEGLFPKERKPVSPITRESVAKNKRIKKPTLNNQYKKKTSKSITDLYKELTSDADICASRTPTVVACEKAISKADIIIKRFTGLLYLKKKLEKDPLNNPITKKFKGLPLLFKEIKESRETFVFQLERTKAWEKALRIKKRWDDLVGSKEYKNFHSNPEKQLLPCRQKRKCEKPLSLFDRQESILEEYIPALRKICSLVEKEEKKTGLLMKDCEQTNLPGWENQFKLIKKSQNMLLEFLKSVK